MFTAQKFCKFAGQEFRIGEIIPDELIHREAIPRLKASGMIAEYSSGSLLTAAGSIDGSPDDMMENIQVVVPVFKDDQKIECLLDEEQIGTWATILQSNVSDAADMIASVDDEDLLMVIHATDSRKGVKTAVEERVTSLKAEEESEAAAEEESESAEEENPETEEEE
jgi:hypothetical protein